MNRFLRAAYITVEDDGIRRVYALIRDPYGEPIGLEYFGLPDEDRGMWRQNEAPAAALADVTDEQIQTWAREARAAAGVNSPYPMRVRFGRTAA